MSFEERKRIGEIAAESVGRLFKSVGFQMVDFGYENAFSNTVRQKLRRLYNDATVKFVRFMPDKFAYLNEKNIFLIEVKVCNAPIIYDARVEKLRKITGIQTLNKNNIGAIETSAVENYQNIGTIGVKILLVIYSSFHNRPLNG